MAENGERRRASFWRMGPWIGATLLLLLPAVAMRFDTGVDWDATDFIIMGVMLYGACGLFELGVRASRSTAYRAAIGVAVLGAFLLTWFSLAVGIIGSEDNPANWMYVAVLAIGASGAFVARCRADGMARALAAVALAQVLVGIIALVGRLGVEGENWPQVIIVLNGFFAGLWLFSSWLFRKAARGSEAVAVTA